MNSAGSMAPFLGFFASLGSLPFDDEADEADDEGDDDDDEGDDFGDEVTPAAVSLVGEGLGFLLNSPMPDTVPFGGCVWSTP
jgi:hypothetical protein